MISFHNSVLERESRLKKEGKIWHEHEFPRDYSNCSSSLHYSNVAGNDKKTGKIVLYVDWMYRLLSESVLKDKLGNLLKT